MPRTLIRITHPAAAMLAIGALALAASAHAPPADPPPAEPPATSPTTPPPAPEQPPTSEPPAPPPALPGLDELLGLPGDRKPADAPADAATDTQNPSETDLDRRLSGQQIDHAFREAVALMDQAAKRLGATDAQRAGVGTQRIQEDAVRKLEQLIASLEQQANSKSRSSSSSSSRGQEQARSQPQQQQQSRAEQAQGENNSEMEPPPRQDGQLRPELDSARASWGALPERVRDMLLQGSSDQFSSMYEKMTESYYRRLAEERRPQ